MLKGMKEEIIRTMYMGGMGNRTDFENDTIQYSWEYIVPEIFLRFLDDFARSKSQNHCRRKFVVDIIEKYENIQRKARKKLKIGK